ncbi:MAG: 23S rRNA (guanosine(2251)-2'-O)-methyltransferase RlmB [Candidatus Promineifilaceae bacterium]|nr:23S rRNA (guanosine(2251)-2'-O)-methyltransferase RlmB [Candidatus Promineifilaceae bacterium]
MSEILIRRNTVLEALRGNRRDIHRLWIENNLNGKQIEPLLRAAQERKVPIKRANKQIIGNKAKDRSHQGVLLETGPYLYSSTVEILDLAAHMGEPPLLLILDLLHGPQNIGSLLRTAEICGVHGVILQDRNAPDITPAIAQYSAGATEHLLITQVTNLVTTIRQLKQENIWVVGLDMVDHAQMLGQTDLSIPLAVVVGHEGSGLRRLVRTNCDFVIRLPMRGHVESLNAAIAGSILLYAAWQARGFPGAS